MTRNARWAMALWLLLALVVFSVRFDWRTRMAGHEFVRRQIQQHRQGLPVQTINDGFRPMVRDAAIEAAGWMALIAVGGAALISAADRKIQVR